TVAFPEYVTSIDARPVSESCTFNWMNWLPFASVPVVGGGQTGGWLLKLPKRSPETAETALFGIVTVHVKLARVTVAPPPAVDWSTVFPIWTQPDCCTSVSVHVVVPLDGACSFVVNDKSPDESVVT